MRGDRLALLGASLLAVALLAGALAWHVPMMLWDHLDLVPMIEGWQQGSLAGSGFLGLHGGHMHSAAYAVLLATTVLSDGQPWVDAAASWCLLLAWLGLVVHMARASGAASALAAQGPAWALAGVLFALHPGHLSNLQWGWQVAVFLCLAGVGAAIALLCARQLDLLRNLAALCAAVLACFSFATGIALLPVAVVLIALRREQPLRQRCWMALPWMALALLAWLHHAGSAPADTGEGAPQYAIYALNYLGAGLARFSPEAAPWLALVALLMAAWVLRRDALHAGQRPWLGLLLFGIACAALTAVGRAGAFGSSHAFVTRYVSFSSVFWLGWLGVMLLALQHGRWQRGRGTLIGVVLCLAAFNGLHMVRQAVQVARASAGVAGEIACSWPAVDRALLEDIYFGRAEAARERLERLREWGFPPFSAGACTSDGDRAVAAPRSD